MKPHQWAVNMGMATAGLLALSSAPAQAFSFTTNLAAGSNAPKGNIFLESVSFGGTTFSDFTLVTGANIRQNDEYRGGNTGAASADRGDTATGVKKQDPTEADVVAALGNLNLNNIIDTEDKGKFTIDLFFGKAVNTLFLWERGQNSTLNVQALNSAGTPVGTLLTLNSKDWDYAGFDIDTTEIGSAQPVGSMGVTLADLGVTGAISGIRTQALSSYNGPDFKVVGGDVPVATPEPSALVGLGLAAGAVVTAGRRRAAQSAEA
ncbi:PEP-CTERM sorting domain-containing protein [Romeria aff. gracilis LEGE 07310]|uniref:PEP-CTERM sorting domain-containing protein n=1 Tax=Vasconcelosia minhoensis LEGE 07310 TaxID=915328 RepID=A0A8J7AJ02_9CYAN|nr:exosortase-dependent surface protein XDP2 [Romeria gracilis]MBE9076275.1 PEP-CTERM sorting domain-containing protein [Romeria aff. gracilis LEGE 07310]